MAQADSNSTRVRDFVAPADLRAMEQIINGAGNTGLTYGEFEKLFEKEQDKRLEYHNFSRRKFFGELDDIFHIRGAPPNEKLYPVSSTRPVPERQGNFGLRRSGKASSEQVVSNSRRPPAVNLNAKGPKPHQGKPYRQHLGPAGDGVNAPSRSSCTTHVLSNSRRLRVVEIEGKHFVWTDDVAKLAGLSRDILLGKLNAVCLKVLWRKVTDVVMKRTLQGDALSEQDVLVVPLVSVAAILCALQRTAVDEELLNELDGLVRRYG